MKTRIQQGFTLIELLVVITIIAILAGLALPTFTKIQEKGNMTKGISNCRQIITVLRIYSSDNGGMYPDTALQAGAGGGAGGGGGGGGGGANQTSNDVFRELFKTASIDTEAIFGCPSSRDGNPDGNIGTAPNYDEALKPGECHWAMTGGLSDSASGTYPIVYENPAAGAWPSPTWNPDAAGTGGRRTHLERRKGDHRHERQQHQHRIHHFPQGKWSGTQRQDPHGPQRLQAE